MKGLRTFALVFAGCVAVGAAALFLLAPYGRTLFDRFQEAAKSEGARTGRDIAVFAGEHEQAECVPEALRRLAACDGIMCKAGTPIFANGCLARARRSPALCADVPGSVAPAVVWAIGRCVGTTDEQVCRKIYAELAQACTH